MKIRPIKKRKLFITMILLLIVIVAIVYKLADRYLIEHVEVIVQNEESTDSKPASIAANDVHAKVDDHSYTSDNIEIKINQVQSGSASDQITYYVADVVLKDSSNLLSAFADNQFGRNIIENTSTIADDNHEIFAINGDYYGFRDDIFAISFTPCKCMVVL